MTGRFALKFWPGALLCLILVAVPIHAATSDEIWQIYNKGEPAKAAAMGLEALETAPDDQELLQVTGRALVDSEQFKAAIPLLKRAVELDSRHSWRSAWALAFAGIAHFGLGENEKAKTAFQDSIKLNATRNVINFANRNQVLLGLSDIYSNWTTIETAHFRFHFSPAITNIDNAKFAEARERAFEEINEFFHATVPKKIDFFAWRESADAQRVGLGSLGFSRPEVSIVHSTYRQTLGHEMTHVISHHAIKPVKRTALINEGVAVYFDQSDRNRLETARRAIQDAKVQSISITELWTNLRSKDDGTTYPIAGAFIERLRTKGGDQKLKELLRDQSLESARRIYGDDLSIWIAEFEKDL